MTTNQDLHEQVAAYALDALDDDERRAYEAHLAGCEQCRAELAGLTDTAGLRRAHAAGFDQVLAKSALQERASEVIGELLAPVE